jgi:hypothetical protein
MRRERGDRGFILNRAFGSWSVTRSISPFSKPVCALFNKTRENSATRNEIIRISFINAHQHKGKNRESADK